METQPALIEVPVNKAPAIPPGFYINKTRPGYSSPEVLIMVVNKLLPQVMQWGKFREDEAQGIAEQIMKALKDDTDGYQRVKFLERHFSWDGDSELVDIMECDDFYGCTREAVMAWIKDNAVVPLFEVGRQVSVKIARQAEMLSGIIREISKDGTYCVGVPSLGHVESGNGTHGFVYPWEEVEAWNSAKPD